MGYVNARYNPRFNQLTAVQLNPFIKFQGLEAFGIYEIAMNSEDEGNGKFTQIGAELIYRFGGNENFYVGGRYNTVSGEQKDITPSVTINRINFGGGWYLTKNVMTKVEYVMQTYDNGENIGSKFEGAEFSGFMVEATIGF